MALSVRAFSGRRSKRNAASPPVTLFFFPHYISRLFFGLFLFFIASLPLYCLLDVSLSFLVATIDL
jgi:hypothetical protein